MPKDKYDLLSERLRARSLFYASLLFTQYEVEGEPPPGSILVPRPPPRRCRPFLSISTSAGEGPPRRCRPFLLLDGGDISAGDGDTSTSYRPTGATVSGLAPSFVAHDFHWYHFELTKRLSKISSHEISSQKRVRTDHIHRN